MMTGAASSVRTELSRCRCALSISVAAALLSGCGGTSVPTATDNTIAGASARKHSQTFGYTGAKQTFIVPAGVRQLTISAHGGAGAGFSIRNYNLPGFPGRIYAIVRVHPGDKLYIFVGGSGGHGGFNGGGAGGAAGNGSGYGNGSPGGGASDVRVGGDKVNDRIIVAAGGGGSGGTYLYSDADGGNGGGLVGESGFGYSGISGGGGGGGTQSTGGSGGSGGLGSQSKDGQPGANGALGVGGNGGNGVAGGGSYSGLGGGGGGGGYYGGGGGGGGAKYDGGGGGGGSSYVEPGAITSRMWTGWRATGDGRVVIRWN